MEKFPSREDPSPETTPSVREHTGEQIDGAYWAAVGSGRMRGAARVRFQVRRHPRMWAWTAGTEISSSNSGNRVGW